MGQSMAIELSRVRYVRRKWKEQSMPELSPQECIDLCFKEHKRICVSWSGGKCSTAVLHMVLQDHPDVQVFHNRTGVQYPETVKYVNRLAKEWQLQLTINKPRTTFWKIVKKYGFPQMRALGLDKTNRPPVPKCCKLLKEEPVRRAYRYNLIQGDIDGLRVAESRVRSFAIGQRGQYYYTKSYRVWRYHPIALWTSKQLQAYYDEYDIPLNPLYKMGYTRSGCWCCTAFKDWAKNLSKTHPKMYRSLAKQMGKTLLDDFPSLDKDLEEEWRGSVVDRECDQKIRKGQLDLLEFL